MIARRHMLAISGSGWLRSLGAPLVPQAPSFRSTVNLVLLDVLATDDAGHPVLGLQPANFRIKEKNRWVKVDRLAPGSTEISLGIALDFSRSMINSQARVVQAVGQVRRRLAPVDEAFILAFNEHVTNVVPAALVGDAPPGRWTAPLYELRPDGQTALYDAIVQAASHLDSAKHERRAMLVLSDGKDTASHAKREDAALSLLRSNVLLYVVGLFERNDPDADARGLSHLAEQSGGRAIFEPKLELLVTEFDRIMAELRARYVLGFITTDSTLASGEIRRVKVYATDANGRSLKVRAREAFFIGGEPK